MYKLSAAAEQDIEELLTRSIVDFGLPQTEIYYQSLKDCLCLIGENPELGAKIDDIREGYRRFPHQSHHIYYQIRQSHILIVRILHKRMDAIKAIVQTAQDQE